MDAASAAATEGPAGAYARAVHAEVTDWYKTVETKAQVILTLNGVFISFIAGSLIQKQADLSSIVDAFGVETWFLLGAMTICVLFAVLSAVWCLRARGLTEERRRTIYRALGIDPARPETLTAGVLWFFFLIAGLEPAAFAARVQGIDAKTTADVLSRDAVILARYVTIKHVWVNRGFVLSGAAVTLFWLTVASYVVRTAIA